MLTERTIHLLAQGKNARGGGGGGGASSNFTPEMLKRALEEKKRAPDNPHRLQCKDLLNVAYLVSGMWKVARENKNVIFSPVYCMHTSIGISVWITLDL